MDHVDRILEQWHRERPDLDVAPMGTIGRIKRVHDAMLRGLEGIYGARGINAASFDVLATLRRSGPPYALSPSELTRWTMVTSGTMTNRLDRLQAAGLIERRPNPADGRGNVVALSDAGFALVEEAVTEHVARQHALVAALSPDQRAALDTILRDLLGALDPDAAP